MAEMIAGIAAATLFMGFLVYCIIRLTKEAADEKRRRKTAEGDRKAREEARETLALDPTDPSVQRGIFARLRKLREKRTTDLSDPE